jgi:hypothetical protein
MDFNIILQTILKKGKKQVKQKKLPPEVQSSGF